MKPEISVIIPAFNVAQYIERSLDSVLGQSYTDFEILVVDDASTDATASIVETYCHKDSRVHLIRQASNQGMGEARNRGNIQAQGTYIFYLDSDDWLDSDALAVVYKIAEERQADIVAAGSRIAYDDGSSAPYHAKDIEAHGGVEAFEKIAAYEIGTIVWNRLYRRSWMNEHALRFLPIYHEDVIFSMEAAYFCHVYCSTSYVCYNYFQRKTSITHKKISYINFIGYFEIMRFITEFFAREQLDQTTQGKKIQQQLYFSQMQWMIPHVLRFLQESGKLQDNIALRQVMKKYFGASYYFLEGLLDYFQWRLYAKNELSGYQTAWGKRWRSFFHRPGLLLKYAAPYGLVRYWEKRKKV